MSAREMPAPAAERIKLVIFDVDGVLTDGAVFMGKSEQGVATELKSFDIQDGIGIKLLMWAGLEVAIVSGRVSAATEIRAKELGISECHQEPNAYKLGVVEQLLAKKSIGWDEVAMLADDIPDLAVLKRVGLKAAVANATRPVLEIADWTSSKGGGRGAAREFCDALLEARGQLDAIVEWYVDERSRV